MPDFLNIPLQVANQVMKKMDLMDLLSARKVCKSLRTAIEKFDSHCDRITFTIHNDDIKMELDNNKITYTNVDNRGTKVTCNGRETQIEGENYVEIALNDLKTALKNVSTFHICMSTLNRHPITRFMDFLRLEKIVHAWKIILWHIPFDDVLTILPYFDAETLENIELVVFKQIVQFERITYLDQWKNARNYRFWSDRCDNEQIDFLFHFREFAVVHSFSIQIAVKIRDDLMRRSTFQSCQIFFEKSKSNTDLIEVAKVFKPDYAGGDTYKLEYSNDNNNNFSIECGLRIEGAFRFYVKRL